MSFPLAQLFKYSHVFFFFLTDSELQDSDLPAAALKTVNGAVLFLSACVYVFDLLSWRREGEGTPESSHTQKSNGGNETEKWTNEDDLHRRLLPPAG